MAPAFWEAYLRALNNAPIRTKALTGGTSLLSAQALSQIIVSGRVTTPSKVSDFAIWGFLSSITAHYWQIFMTKNGPSTFLPKLLLDHVLYRVPILVAFGIYVRVMEGKALPESIKITLAGQRQLQPTAAKVWLSANVFNFTVVPDNLRVFYQNVVQFFWSLYLAFSMRASQAPAKALQSPTSFVLIGGAMHCSKHFGKLKPLLEASGHEVIAPDLPGLGDDARDPKTQTLETHVAAIVESMGRAAHGPVVLVGHSLAGIPISAAAEAKPELIKRLVFLSAETRPGAPWGETATNPGPTWMGENLLDFTDGMMAAAKGKEERLSEFFFSGADPVDVKAMAKLLRPHPGYSEEALVLSAAKYGSVPKAYVKTLRDQVNLPVHQDTWHQRLGKDVPKFELDCGHGSFVSNPQDLADVLKKIAGL